MSKTLDSVILERAVDKSWYDLADSDELEAQEDEVVNQCKSIFLPYGPQGPRITLNSAMGILNR